MPWKKIDLNRWANEMGVDLHEIEQKLRLCEMIAKIRNDRELTQKDLAALAGTSRSRIAQIESGIKLHKMSFDVLFRTLQALGYRYSIKARKQAA